MSCTRNSTPLYVTGFFGWRDMPAALRDRIAGDVATVAAAPVVRERLDKIGVTSRASTPSSAGLTIYPVTKVTPQRGADILETHGNDMICVNSASDWGESGPHMLTDTYLEYRRRGHSEADCLKVFFNNPCRFFGQCPKWKIRPLE